MKINVNGRIHEIIDRNSCLLSYRHFIEHEILVKNFSLIHRQMVNHNLFHRL